MTLNVLSIIVKGLNHPMKCKSLWKEQHSLMHFSSLVSPKCLHRNYPFVFIANAESKTRGVLIAIRDTVAFTLHEEIIDPQGRFLSLICDLNSTTYTIATVYSLNKHQVHFFNKLMKKI